MDWIIMERSRDQPIAGFWKALAPHELGKRCVVGFQNMAKIARRDPALCSNFIIAEIGIGQVA